MIINPFQRISGIRQRWHDRQFRVSMYLYSGSFMLVALFAFPAIMTASSNPSFCAACHSQTPEVETWKRSAHSKITCYSCHGARSYVSLVTAKLFADSKVPLLEVFGKFEKPINAHSHVSQELIPMERCERCHANANRKFTFSQGIKMDHMAHKKAEINCTVCHNRVTHLGAEKFEPLKSWNPKFRYKNFLKMRDGCYRCHSMSAETRDPETMKKIMNGKKPPHACTACHTKDFTLPAGHNTVSWRSLHGKVALSNMDDCMTCHSEKAKFSNGGDPWCTLCHDKSRVVKFIGRTWKNEHEDEGHDEKPSH